MIHVEKNNFVGVTRFNHLIPMYGSLDFIHGPVKFGPIKCRGGKMVRGIHRNSHAAQLHRGPDRATHHRRGHDVRSENRLPESSSERNVSLITGDRSRLLTNNDPGAALSLHSATQLAFRVRSQSKIRVDDDGTLRAVNKTQLRFKYDLQTQDGLDIQLRAKAKIKQSIRIDENGDTTIKTRVKLQFSLIQQDVSNGLQPLQSSLPEGDTNPLQSFIDLVDGVVADFADDGQIDADTLIATVLNEFNSLLTSLSGGLQEGSDAETIDGDVIDVVPTPIYPLADEPVADVNGDVPTEPVILEADAETDGAGIIAVDESTETGVDSTAELVSAPPIAPLDGATEPGSSADALVTAGDVTAADVTAADVDAKVETTREVLQEVRIRFIQSFSQVIKTLTPSGDDDAAELSLVQSSRFKFDARFQYSAATTSAPTTDFLA